MNTILKRTYQNTHQDVADKFAVKELIEFERFCRDNALWDEMNQCFTTDSKVTVSWFQGTGQAFVEASSKMTTYAPHKLNNTLIWLSGNRAIAITMATIQIRATVEGQQLELHSDVKLIYRTEKRSDTWYIAAMDAIYEKDALISVSPTCNIVISIEKISKYRPSYAYLSYLLENQGHKVDTNLPGIDKPELVNNFYQEAENWLTK